MSKLIVVLLSLVAASAWAAPTATPSPAPAVASKAEATPSVRGQVMEVKDVDPYTYLRLETKKGELWAAVSKAPVKVGSQVAIENSMMMENFESKALGRKFDRIVFGSLAGTTAPAGTMPGQAAARSVSHANPAKTPDVAPGSIPKAAGPDGRTVAEVYAESAKLKGRTVAVRGKVVKFASNIVGKKWTHLKDGTGKPADGTSDLVVTTKESAKAGEVVTVKGVVRTDVDIGMAVTYRMLLEDATLAR